MELNKKRQMETIKRTKIVDAEKEAGTTRTKGWARYPPW